MKPVTSVFMTSLVWSLSLDAAGWVCGSGLVLGTKRGAFILFYLLIFIFWCDLWALKEASSMSFRDIMSSAGSSLMQQVRLVRFVGRGWVWGTIGGAQGVYLGCGSEGKLWEVVRGEQC